MNDLAYKVWEKYTEEFIEKVIDCIAQDRNFLCLFIERILNDIFRIIED